QFSLSNPVWNSSSRRRYRVFVEKAKRFYHLVTVTIVSAISSQIVKNCKQTFFHNMDGAEFPADRKSHLLKTEGSKNAKLVKPIIICDRLLVKDVKQRTLESMVSTHDIQRF